MNGAALKSLPVECIVLTEVVVLEILSVEGCTEQRTYFFM